MKKFELLERGIFLLNNINLYSFCDPIFEIME